MQRFPLFVSILICFLIISKTGFSENNGVLQEALTLDRQGFIEESIQAWKKVLDSKPEKKIHIYAQIKLCIAYSKSSMFGDALKEAKNLAEKFPNQFNVAFNLGNMYSATHQYQQAIEAYKKVVELQPNEGLGYVGLGLSLFGNQIVEESLETLRKVRKLFKTQKNISWYQNVRIMIGQIKGFAPYPPDFSNLWLANNLREIRTTYEQTIFRNFEKQLNL